MVTFCDGENIPTEHCVTAATLLAYPTCCSEASQLVCSEAAIQKQLDISIQQVEAITNTQFCPKAACYIFSGDGTKELLFNSQTMENMTSLTSVVQDNGDGTTTALTPTVYENSLRFSKTSSSVFTCGKNNITVCAQWGEQMPAAVEKVIVYMTLESLQPGILGLSRSDGLMDTITWEDVSLKYNTSGSSQFDPFSTGFFELDQLLFPHVPTSSKIGFGLVGDSDCESRSCDPFNKRRRSKCQD
tara:strand:- start:35589 stop:36320 length:732 start_codon:yes stop_codon:yes gene_type:complete